jgi:DNA-binding MarR family transcriptional regulator
MLCFALYDAAHAMQQAYKPLLDPLGLTYPQYLLMSALWVRDDQTLTDLGRQLRLESNTLTPLVKRLEAKGLIARERDRADERQLRVRLTREGQALQAEAVRVPRCIRAETGLSDAALTELRATLQALQARLRAAGMDEAVG